LLAYEVGIQFLGDTLIASVVYFSSLVAIVFFLVFRFGIKQESLSGERNDTMKNLKILLAFLAVFSVIFYIFFLL
jgi:hypothetical protein